MSGKQWPSGPGRRLEWLVAMPVLGSLALLWATAAFFTLQQRTTILVRTKGQLGATVTTLADFNQLTEVAGSSIAARASQGRSDAIWRALLQYPTESIWLEKNGVLSAGQPPPGSPAKYLQVEDARSDFTVHAAIPLADVLAGWRRAAWEGGAVLLALSGALLLLAQLLTRALRQRALAEREMAAAEERASQLALYRAQLERTVAERTADLEVAKGSLESELSERKAAELALREHDALLNAVTQSAAELLGARHEDAISVVLELIGQTVSVSRVQLAQITTDSAGHLRSSVRHEWCAPGTVASIDIPALQDLDLSAHLPRALGPSMVVGPASFFVADISGHYRALFEQARMRSFLQLPVTVEEQLWGSLNFIDSSEVRRAWSWAESDTLKTLAGLIGVAISRAQYVKDLADANMIVQNSPTILYRLKGEPSLPLIYISHNITKFGHDPQTLVGAPNWSEALIDSNDAPKVRAAMARALEKDAQAATIEFRLRTGDGTHRWVENRYTPVRDKNGLLKEVEGIIIDITERKAAEEKIAQLARTDGLTGLANRTTFVERLHQAFAAAHRGAAPFAILYIDLDHFKDVNDTLGHPVGDDLLREVSQRLKAATRDSDFVARLGGDEFAILQADLGELAHAGTLAEKITRSLAAVYQIQGNTINISASIGISPYTNSCANPDAMLAQADLALYRSKDEGRNQYHFHSEDLDQQVIERLSLADDLRRALEQGQLEIYYQPQVELVSGKIVGMEALLRWHHPTRGLLSAAAFVPLAEKAGLMTALGSWVIEQVCRQMRAWRDEGIAPPLISVNLSLSQIKSGRELLRCVEEALECWGIEASCLEFDVTEATLAQVTMMQTDALQQLRRLGASIAIDDFGTEFSSFEYLRTYRVSQLKIAQSFVSAASNDPERAATIRAIMNIARELGIGIIAEGIETEEQRRMLAATGSAALGQGFNFSEAVDAPRAAELLRQGGVGPVTAEDDGGHIDQLFTARNS